MEEIWIDDPTVEVCLNCKQLWCSGEYEKVRNPNDDGIRWIIQRKFSPIKGTEKVGYVHYISKNRVVSYQDKRRARQYKSPEDARKAVEKALAISSRNKIYTIVEIKRKG